MIYIIHHHTYPEKGLRAEHASWSLQLGRGYTCVLNVTQANTGGHNCAQGERVVYCTTQITRVSAYQLQILFIYTCSCTYPFLTSKETVQNTAKNKSVCTFTMLGLECWSIGRELQALFASFSFFLSGVSIKTNWNYRIHDQTALIADSVEKNEQTYNGSMSYR